MEGLGNSVLASVSLPLYSETYKLQKDWVGVNGKQNLNRDDSSFFNRTMIQVINSKR